MFSILFPLIYTVPRLFVFLQKHIIEQLLSKDVAKRPSASGVLELLKLVAKKNPDTKNVHTC